MTAGNVADSETNVETGTDTAGESGGETQITCDVRGMHCAGCVANVEKAISGVSGVHDVKVNLVAEKAWITVGEDGPAFTELAGAVDRAGFTLRAAAEDIGRRREELLRSTACLAHLGHNALPLSCSGLLGSQSTM